MTSKRLYIATTLLILLLSCASPKAHNTFPEKPNTRDLTQSSGSNEIQMSFDNEHYNDKKYNNKKNNLFATNQKYSNGLEVYEEFHDGRFKYEYKPSQKECYLFEYSENPETGLDSGMQIVLSNLEHMTEDLVYNLENPKNINNVNRTEIVLIPTTFVNIDDVHNTTSFGRYCSEQLSNYLSVKGIQVVEIRKLENILVKEKFGEYGISRISNEIAKKFNANSIMVGTYTVTPTDIILNVRIIKADNNSAIVRSVATSQFSRKNNLLVNYLISKANSLNMHDQKFGTTLKTEVPNIGITTVTLSE